MTAYGGRDDGLFIGGICESPFFPTHRTVNESEFQFQRFITSVGCLNATDPIACLRSKDTATLQSADVLSPFPGAKGLPDWSFLPVVDGTFSQDRLYTLFQQGKMARVPTIVGDDTDEGTYFAANASTSAEFLEFIRSNYPSLSNNDLECIKKTYPLMAPLESRAAWFPSAAAAYGDATFTCPGLEISRSMAKYLSPDNTWNYRYNVMDWDNIRWGLGVPHVFEMPAIFGVGMTKPCVNCSYSTYNSPIVPIVMDYWISFIKGLDPNRYRNPDAPYWHPFGQEQGQERRLKFQTNATAMEGIPQYQRDRCSLWKSMVSRTEQ